MSTFSERIIGAAQLEVQVYKDVKADTTAIGQAMTVVALSSLAEGIGALTLGGFRPFVIGIATALIGWFVWVFTVYLVGTRILPEPDTGSDLTQVLRTTGFAATPGVLRVLGLVPFLRVWIAIAVTIWMVLGMLIAVRQALDYNSFERAVGVCLIGWVAHIVIMVILRG
jgi:hypothetical protein